MSIIEKALEKSAAVKREIQSETRAFGDFNPVSRYETDIKPETLARATASREDDGNVIRGADASDDNDLYI